MPKVKSIKLSGNISIKLEEDLLDIYAVKKFDTPYASAKKKVNSDLQKLSREYNTTAVKDIRFLIMLNLLPKQKKEAILSLYSDRFTT